MSIRNVGVLLGAAIIFGVSQISSASIVLVQLNSFPASIPADPDFQFAPIGINPPSFQTDTGSVGNGDGTLATSSQTAPGLQATSAFVVSAPGVDGSGKILYDTSLLLTGLAASSPATSNAGIDQQMLGSGGFQLWSTTTGPSDPTTTEVLLLSGTISSAYIVGVDSGNAGATFSAGGVDYTGGLIYNALVSAGGTTTGDSMSISLNNVIPNFGINGSTGYLNNFTSDATGLFNVSAVSGVPEPTVLLSLGVAGGIALLRRPSRKH